MNRKSLTDLDDPQPPPSLYDGPQDAAEDIAAGLPPGPRPAPGGRFDPATWQRAQGLCSGDLAAACLAFGRLDTRLDLAGAAAAGLRLRLALHEMADLDWLMGARIGLERLSLFTALRIGAGEDAAVLGQLAWGVRRLTGSARPKGGGSERDGSERGWESGLAAFLGFQGEAVRDLAEAMAGTEALHPLTQAALLFHAWQLAGAERLGRDMEGGVMAARHAGRIGRGALFVPLALGTAAALRGQGTVAARLAAFYRGAEQATLAALLLLDRLAAWQQRADAALHGCTGRVPGQLLAVFAHWPMVSAALAEAQTGASRAAVQRNLDLLAARGIIREITGQRRYRLWAAAL